MATTNTNTNTNTVAATTPTTTPTINIVIKGLGHNIKLESINPSLTTLDDLQSIVETHTNLPPCYQRLICNGKTLTSSLFGATGAGAGAGKSTSTSTSTSNEGSTKEDGSEAQTQASLTLAQFGIGIQRKRVGRPAAATTSTATSANATTTKIILMHNSMYVQDKATIDLIIQQSDKLNILEVEFNGIKQEGQQRQQKESDLLKLKSKYHHQITELCCKLDSIDIDTSKPTSTSLRQMRKKVLQRADLLEKSMNDYFSSSHQE
mmetsp:Transcript_24372/g.36325  ORF Transcript_24372/g.36325 Transcript_24372/m.36325 type:complete len:263 (-) Transcript_24372:155-943(-)